MIEVEFIIKDGKNLHSEIIVGENYKFHGIYGYDISLIILGAYEGRANVEFLLKDVTYYEIRDAKTGECDHRYKREEKSQSFKRIPE